MSSGSFSRRHSHRFAQVLVLAMVTLLPMAACASIPTRTEPKVIESVDENPSMQTTAPAPPEDLDPLGLVRNFIRSTADPENDYAAARRHLTTQARNAWNVPSDMLIVDHVDTVKVDPPQDVPPNVRLVSLRATKVGKLRRDQSFVPLQGSYRAQFRVKRQPDGKWRIANQPKNLVVQRGAFTDTYKPIKVYFLDQQRDGVVPDRRYVVGDPASTLPARAIDLLLAGPSKGFRSAMGTALPPNADTATNVSEASDGALVVNFNDLGDPPSKTRRLIAAQVVLTLQGVSNARVRLQTEGTPLLPGNPVLRPADVAEFKQNNRVRPEVSGLAVANERLVVLNEKATPVDGPAGSGRYEVLTADLSANGSRLAAVVGTPNGVQLRVGPFGAALNPLRVRGNFMSMPTWRSSDEVWTVIGGRQIVRVVRTADSGWTRSQVDASAFGSGFIRDLRISPDGTRVAAVVDGEIVVAGIVDGSEQVSLRNPTVLKGGPVNAAIRGVEWLQGDTLVAVSKSKSIPVFAVTVDGFKWSKYAANVVQPVSAVTVGPDHKVVVSDPNGLWKATGPDDLWSMMQVPVGGRSIPFYPG